MDNKTMKWILIAAIVLIVFGMRGALPKEGVPDVTGQPCLTDDDCPCFGDYTYPSGTNTTAYGVGLSSCHTCSQADITGNKSIEACDGRNINDKVCDTTWCYDVEPWAEWGRDNPWQWLKDNPIITLGIVALIIVLLTWPKS